MKRDQNYVSRLEVGDRIATDRGETVKVNRINRDGSFDAGTVGTGDSYLRMFNADGSGKSPSCGNMKTP
jgi:hypothetical protein